MAQQKTSGTHKDHSIFFRLIAALVITFLIGLAIMGIQSHLDTLKNEYFQKGTFWLLVIMLGSFNYDIFKTIIYMRHDNFKNFAIYIFKMSAIIISISAATFALAFSVDNKNYPIAVITVVVIVICIGFFIKYFSKTLDYAVDDGVSENIQKAIDKAVIKAISSEISDELKTNIKSTAVMTVKEIVKKNALKK